MQEKTDAEAPFAVIHHFCGKEACAVMTKKTIAAIGFAVVQGVMVFLDETIIKGRA